MKSGSKRKRNAGGHRSPIRRLYQAKAPATPEAIPESLRGLRRWLVWDYFDYGEGKPRKVPVRPGTDYGLSWNIADNWRSFDEVLSEATTRPGIGIGFVFDEGDGLIGVDQDDAYDDAGNLKPWAREICSKLSDTYGERTPSGRGIHHIGKAARVEGKKRCELVPGKDAIERYSQDRWFTFTGDVIADREVADVRQAMVWLAEKHFAGERSQPHTSSAASVSFDTDPELDTELARVCVELLSTARASNAEDWRLVGYALKNTSDSLYPVWLAFSKRWPECDEAECSDRWSRFKPANIGIGTLVYMAAQDSGRSAIELRDAARERLGRAPWQPAAITAAAQAVVESATADDPHSGGLDLSRPHTMTDIGAGRRLAREVRGRLVYVRERGMWAAFDGTRYIENSEHVALQYAKRQHDQLWRELSEVDERSRQAAGKYVLESGHNARITACVMQARTEPGINVSHSDFDTHPWLLNVANGVLDLRSGELLPHDAKYMITQLAAVEYQPGATSDLWQRFIADVTQGNPELIEFLQQACGLALTGDVSDEVLICHQGGGCNGKSTFLEALAAMLGDYAATAPPGLFTARRTETHPTELAYLHGKRLVTAIEQEANRALRESLVKTLTGGDTITCRRMREDFWQMQPTWHLHIAYNSAPRLTGTDDGIRRRLRVVPWEASFKGSPDLTIKQRLLGEAERPGILNWCLDGLRRRLAAGRLYSPEAVMLATSDYIDDEDLIGRFLADRTERDNGPGVELRALLQALRGYLTADGTPRYVVDQFTGNAVARELCRRGYRKVRPDSGIHRKQTMITGIRLVDTAIDDPHHIDEEWASFGR